LGTDSINGVGIVLDDREQSAYLKRLPTFLEALLHKGEKVREGLPTCARKILAGLNPSDVDPGVTEVGRIERATFGRERHPSIVGDEDVLVPAVSINHGAPSAVCPSQTTTATRQANPRGDLRSPPGEVCLLGFNNPGDPP
jgi:hypothetical protein